MASGVNTSSSTNTNSLQQDMLAQRLPLIVFGLLTASFVLMVRMVLFQAPQDPRVEAEIQRLRDASYGSTEKITSARGMIYDRNGQPLAVNTLRYRIGISPGLLADTETAIQQLSAILDRDPLELAPIVNSSRPWQLLATNVEPDLWRRIDELDYAAIRAEVLPRRYYPQGDLAAQIIGFVGGEGENQRGWLGVEDTYQDFLAGRTRQRTISNIPLDVPQEEEPLDRGGDVVLTLDRDIQYIVRAELQQAMTDYEAESGTIIVMNPRNGDILAMVSLPSFDPNNIAAVEDARVLRNPAISDYYEPGSVFKVLTVAAGLETGAITPDWTYNDTGSMQIATETIYNWDKNAYGIVNVEQILVNSLNIGSATIALEMGVQDFYSMIRLFGIGQRTGVDLRGEGEGILKIPNISEEWSESDLPVNSYGQGVAVTSLQMLNAVNAIANDGLLMQPRIVKQIVQGDTIIDLEPSLKVRVVSKETADMVTEMMVAVVNDGLDDQARLEGYTIAGKTGTAGIPAPTGKYYDNISIVTFVGFLPADDPQISIFVRLDKPKRGYWASQVAAPIFRKLAEKLVLMLEIPTDTVRQELAEQGGVVSDIQR